MKPLGGNPLDENNDSKTLLDSLLLVAEERWDISPDSLMQNMNKIAFHESKLNPYQEQVGGGPGRGLYQYEIGPGQGAHTAINRLINQIGYTPDFLKGIEHSNYDVSILTPEQQSAIFVADKLQDPTASFKGINPSDSRALAEQWADEHWAGHEGDYVLREEMIQKFIKDIAYFNN